MPVISFTKMHGLGNDFVVIDATQKPILFSPALIQQMANRRLGIGFDQLLVLESPDSSDFDFKFRIFNADGTEVGQCGNGARCAALFIRQKELSNKSEWRLKTLTSDLKLTYLPDQKIQVEMGIPRFEPDCIPFVTSEPAHTQTHNIEADGESLTLSVVNVGNPHAIIRVPAIDSEQVSRLGKILSTHPRFPNGVNVGFMQVIDPSQVRLRVYERGAGETLACGSGATAAMVIGRRNGWLHERVTVNQPGGSLTIDWQGPSLPIYMTGPAQIVFEGEWVD